MGLFKKKESRPTPADTPPNRSYSGGRKRQTIMPLEVKLLALEALQHGLTRGEED